MRSQGLKTIFRRVYIHICVYIYIIIYIYMYIYGHIYICDILHIMTVESDSIRMRYLDCPGDMTRRCHGPGARGAAQVPGPKIPEGSDTKFLKDL